jgi:serine phosphatase RsbU (regulator of sigma subunit)
MFADPLNERPEELLKTVLDTVSDGVTVIDRDLKIQYQNRIIVQLFGSGVGRYCYRAYRGRSEPCVDCMVLEVLGDGRERRGIRDIPLPGGGLSLVEISSAAIRDSRGAIVGAVEVARDVTKQKKAEALLNETLLERNAVLKNLNQELSDAAGYVKTVLPQKIRSGALRTDWVFIPSGSLGGDSFGYHWIDEDHFALYLIDVSGHGWAAALFSVSVINVLRSHALPETDFHKPEQVLYALNNTFPGDRHNDMFFTIWYGVYSLPSQQLCYASGGHPPALLYSGASPEPRRAQLLRTPNTIIGGEPGTRYQSRSLEIRSPARLLVFSDGVFDIVKSDGTIWGFAAFLDFLDRSARPDRSVAATLVNRAMELAHRQTFDDDFTFLEVAIHPDGGGRR